MRERACVALGAVFFSLKRPTIRSFAPRDRDISRQTAVTYTQGQSSPVKIQLQRWRKAAWPYVREFLAVQQILVFVGVLICALFAAMKMSFSVWFLLLCIVIIGNAGYILQTAASGWYDRRRFPWNWVVYVPLAGVLSFVCVLAAVGLMRHMVARSLPYWGLFHDVWQVGMVISMGTGLVGYAVTEVQRRLKAKNEELQKAVEQGAVAIAEQEQELLRALEIQRGLLPKDLPQLKGTELAGAWQPARTVGGDYFDVVQFSDTRLGICVGDVSGKGLTAALLMSNLQAAFRAFATEQASPAEVCRKLNAFVAGNVAPGKFITFFYAVLEVQQRILVYENAGHCPGLLVRANGGTEFLRGHGAVLGVIPEWAYQNEALQLATGDRLFFYTDGVTEAEDEAGDEFGYDRLMQAAAPAVKESAAAGNRRIMEEVARFCKGHFRDDVTVVVLAIR